MQDILFMLRVLINDIGNTTYSDDSLTRLILTSAIIVKREISFDVDYKINLELLKITPYETDEVFNLFVSHKAAILLLQSEIRTKTYQSVKIVDGPSSIDLSNISKDMQALLKYSTEQYAKMKLDYTLSQNNGGSFGYAVVTPTTVEYISPSIFS